MLIIENGIKAKQLVTSFTELYDDSFTQRWLKETYPVFCVVKYDETKTNPICVALLHKIDFDSLHIFDNPVLLDYIYTMTEHRRNNYAYNLLRKIMKKNKIIGFCCNDESAKLFVKCGFSYHPDKQWMVRFPSLSNTKTKELLNVKSKLELQKMWEYEKTNSPFIIEGTLRHQENIITAKQKYGLEFRVKIISTKYFGDDADIPTIVCFDDEKLVLGKPRYPECFTKHEYIIILVDKHNSGLFSIDIL
uniref:Uncharacterized protein n=1 Tax=viral metagenome TaxID=1070528 RepID=A0A6C0HT70_9ZZZZ